MSDKPKTLTDWGLAIFDRSNPDETPTEPMPQWTPVERLYLRLRHLQCITRTSNALMIEACKWYIREHGGGK